MEGGGSEVLGGGGGDDFLLKIPGRGRGSPGRVGGGGGGIMRGREGVCGEFVGGWG